MEQGTPVPMDPKTTLVRYLNVGRDALLWKLDGLADYDARRPLTPTGTNLVGLVKHLAHVELGYFGDTFGRPHGIDLGDHSEINADMYAASDESKADILDLYGRARSHTDATVQALELGSQGVVPWWGEANNPVTLHQILVHVATETHRHVGQADILREGIDGAVGLRRGVENMPRVEANWWSDHVAKLQAIAVETS